MVSIIDFAGTAKVLPDMFTSRVGFQTDVTHVIRPHVCPLPYSKSSQRSWPVAWHPYSYWVRQSFKYIGSSLKLFAGYSNQQIVSYTFLDFYVLHRLFLKKKSTIQIISASEVLSALLSQWFV